MAIEQKYIELMSAAIDGEINDSEQAELDAFLSDNVEGRALYEELSVLCATLDSVEAEEAPPHLRHVIMNSLKVPAAKAREDNFLQNLLAAPALRYAATFAAGVFLTLSLINSDHISNRAFDDVTGLVGSVANPVDAELVGSVMIEEAQVAGTVSLRSAGSLMIVDFDLVAPEPIEIEADYSDPSIWFNGFAQLESTGTTVSAANGRVTLGMEGKRRYAVYLHNEGGRETTLNLRFRADGAVVHETSLRYEPAQ